MCGVKKCKKCRKRKSGRREKRDIVGAKRRQWCSAVCSSRYGRKRKTKNAVQKVGRKNDENIDMPQPPRWQPLLSAQRYAPC